MSWARVAVARVRTLLRRKASDVELDEELQFDLDMRIEGHLRRGMSPAEARAAAHRDFGPLELTKERYREARSLFRLETFIRDVVYGSRSLVKSWVFSAVAVLSLMLGIGGNVAIFSLVDTVLLRSLPVRSPAQLRFLRKIGGRSPISYFSLPYYKQIRNHPELMDGVLAFFDAAGTLQVSADASRSGAQPELVRAQLVSGNYFSVLGVRPIAGRELSVQDDAAPDSHPVAVISYSYWHRHFNGSPTVIGTKLLINGSPFTVVGVTPPEFSGLTPGAPPDITVPVMMQSRVWLEPGSSIVGDAKFGWLRLMIRLRPDMPEPRIQAGLSVISRQIDENLAVTPARARRRVLTRIEFFPGERGLDALRHQFSRPLMILMALVGFVQLVACANIAVLLLARAVARQREIGTRLALGATRLRLIRQLLTESSIVAGLGASLGVLFAYATSKILLKVLADSPVPIDLTFVLDRRFLVFTVALTVITALICGLFPAIQTSKLDIASSLSSTGLILGNRSIGRARFSYGKILVVVQLALSLVLLVAAGLFIRSLNNLKQVAVGFEPDNLLLVTINPSMVGYRDPGLSNTYEALLARMHEIPGILSVTMMSHSLVTPGVDDAGFTVPGRTVQQGEPRGVNLDMVGSEFFETMKIPVLFGRGLNSHDGAHTDRVAIVTESIAKQYFKGENPIGKLASIGGPLLEIVGVTADVKFNSLRDEAARVVYLPYRQRPVWHPAPAQMIFAIRTGEQNPELIASTVRKVVSQYDRNLPIASIKTAELEITESLVQERLLAWLSAGFGILGLILGCVGLAGTMAHAVARRNNEIGIRMAIGAQRSEVVWMFLKESITLVLTGSILGLALACALSRFATSLLFGVKPTELSTIAAAALVLIAVIIGAALVPCYRASRMDPVTTLRCE